jgi:hypothetical protein
LWYMKSCATNFVAHRIEFVFVVYENHVPQIQSYVPQIRLSCWSIKDCEYVPHGAK